MPVPPALAHTQRAVTAGNYRTETLYQVVLIIVVSDSESVRARKISSGEGQSRKKKNVSEIREINNKKCTTFSRPPAGKKSAEKSAGRWVGPYVSGLETEETDNRKMHSRKLDRQGTHAHFATTKKVALVLVPQIEHLS